MVQRTAGWGEAARQWQTRWGKIVEDVRVYIMFCLIIYIYIYMHSYMIYAHNIVYHNSIITCTIV